jgi:CBS domain-containing protein
MQLIEIGDARVVSVHSADDIDTAISLMDEHGFRHLPVVDHGEVVGMVSDRDLLTAVGMHPGPERTTVAEGPARVGATRIGEVMTSPARTAAADASLEVAAETMLREGIRALPLVYKDRLAGIVTETDFLKCYLDDRPMGRHTGWRLFKVADEMSRSVVTLTPHDGFVRAVRKMRARNIRHIPIVEDGRLVGMVSDRDMRRILGNLEIETQDEDAGCMAHRPKAVMDDIMTRNVVVTHAPAPLAEAADILVQRKFGSLPVVDDNGIIGIITEADLLRVFVNAFKP